jgi:protein O-GlcNAc transferase
LGEKKRRAAAAMGSVSNGRALEAGPLLERARQLHAANRLKDAQDAYGQILRLEPLQPEAWLGMGMLARQTGARDAALELLAKAAALAPGAAEARMQYGWALQDTGHIEAAEIEWLSACRLRPGDAQCWESLGIVQQAVGKTAAAAAAYGRAYELRPSAGLKVKLATPISPIISSRESMIAERRHMDAALDELLAEAVPAIDDPMHAALWTNFYLAYHGENDRALQAKSAQVYRRLCPALEYVAAHCRLSQREGGKIRVGLISQFFHNHSIGRTSRGLFAQLSREQFDVSAIFIAPAIDDDFSRFIREHADHSVVVPQDLPEARRLIEAQKLDVLFYQDIGMEPFSYFLAFSRLAKVQCVSFGHPDTTGIPAIDYFVSNDLYETPGAKEHYSERLFLLHNLGSLAYYYRPGLPAQRKTRADFGLSEDDHLYLCPQNLFKFHPDMDDLIAGILRRDARGRLVVIAGKIGHWTELMKRRWAASMADVLDRIVFLPRMKGEDYVNLIALADVMLDTVHFNGMNTSLEAFFVGTPVVTWPGAFQRGRHTQAMYRKMGLSECIAGSAQGYVDLALRLANDAAFRSDISGRIVERNAVLFEDIEVVREFERFLLQAAAPPARDG